LLTVLLLVGVGLRVLTEVAYWPAVDFPDSYAYLRNAAHFHPDLWHPLGYPAFLDLIAWTHQIGVVTIVQHGMGLVEALLVVRLLRRLGCGPHAAAAGAAPILLDPIQVYLEQFVLSDVLFMFLLISVLCLATLTAPSRRLAVLCGALVAYAVLVRTIALFAALPIVVYWLAERVRWRLLVAAVATTALPLLLYAGAFAVGHGTFALQGYTGRWLYGRVVGFADCRHDHLPVQVRPLCPRTPAATRVLPSEWVWNPRLPFTQGTRLPDSAVARSRLAEQFARAVILQQPADYADVVLRDTMRAFGPSRDAGGRGWFTGSWQFFLPGQPPFWRVTPMQHGFWSERVRGDVRLGPARFLASYERDVFTPGPFAALAVITAAVVGGRNWRRREGRVILLLLATGLVLLVVPIATVCLDFRYVVGAQQVLVPAGVLSVVTARRRDDMSEVARPVRLRRRALAVASATALCAGGAVSNVAGGEAYARGVSPLPVEPMGATASIGGRLTVTVADPRVVDLACSRDRYVWDVQFSTAEHWHRGTPLLVAADDFAFSPERVLAADPARPWTPYLRPTASSGVLRPYVVSRRYPSTRGTVDFELADPRGTLVYTDPLGAGRAGWRLRVLPDTAGLPPPGSLCFTDA
jgi:hypothetical protein